MRAALQEYWREQCARSNSTGHNLKYFLYIPEVSAVDDVVTDEEDVAVTVVGETNRTQIDDDYTTNSLDFTIKNTYQFKTHSVE